MQKITTTFRLVIVALVGFASSSCMKGPGFLKQGPAETKPEARTSSEPAPLIIQTIESNGLVTGSFNATSSSTQVMLAAATSSIAGSQVEFPPGTLAIDTEIALGPGEQIATDTTAQDLALGTTITSSAPSVVLSSTSIMDASQPFTLQIPIPDSAGLHLDDPFTTLLVIYKIKKVGEGGDFTGYITRDKIDIKSGFARFATQYFGTFQAVYTAKPVTEAKEIVSKPVVKTAKKIYFVKGFAPATFGTDSAKAEGFAGWLHTFRPAKAKANADSTLTTGKVVKISQGVNAP